MKLKIHLASSVKIELLVFIPSYWVLFVMFLHHYPAITITESFPPICFSAFKLSTPTTVLSIRCVHTRHRQYLTII